MKEEGTMRKILLKLPYNIQFFAEGDETGSEGAGVEGNGESGTKTGSKEDAGASTISFDDFLKNPKNQSEFDRRVAKALETNRTKMQADIETQIQNARTEAEKMAKMNAEQKAQYEREKREKEISDREAAITKREFIATTKEQLSESGLPLSLADVLNYTNAEECSKSIEAVTKSFQEAVEQAVNTRLAGGKAPKKAESNGTLYTKEQLATMTPAQINANWEAVQASMKTFN